VKKFYWAGIIGYYLLNKKIDFNFYTVSIGLGSF